MQYAGRISRFYYFLFLAWMMAGSVVLSSPSSNADGASSSVLAVEPKMVRIEGGCFDMGSPPSVQGREQNERLHPICVDTFWIGKYEVGVGEFGLFVEATGYQTDAERRGGGLRGCWNYDCSKDTDSWRYQPWATWRRQSKCLDTSTEQPVACVSWNDAQSYIRWLNQVTAKRYRLPTEAEWEYAARAGRQIPNAWVEQEVEQACKYANVADDGHGWSKDIPCDDGYRWAAPVGSFPANGWGLHDMLGNLWEWTCSKYDEDYRGEERQCSNEGGVEYRAVRGGSWLSAPNRVRFAYRSGDRPGNRVVYVGFRLAMDEPE